MAGYLAGVDVGTTGARCMLFETDGSVVGGTYREYGAAYPKPGWVEQDSDDLIAKTMEACKATLDSARIDPKEIASIGFSTQRSVTCPVFEDGSPVRPMISWQDARCGEEVAEMGGMIDAGEFYETTGLPLGTTWLVGKILWMRKHEPELYEKTFKFAQNADVVLKAFGAEDFHTDICSTVFYGTWDVKKAVWNEKLMSLFGLSAERLGRPTPAGTRVGEISSQAAKNTGFAKGTPICVGAGDQNCAAVGMGAVKPGIGTVTLGTCGMAMLATEKPVSGFGGMMCTNHAVDGMGEIEGLTNAAGSAYRWFRDIIAVSGADGRDPYVQMNEWAEAAPMGSKGLLFLPYLATAASPRWNHNARAAFLGLSFAHGRGEMSRAVMEGVTLEIRDIIERWLANGLEVDTLRIGGGATRSELWNQIQADVYGRPVQTLEGEESACLGAALLGGFGAGVFDSIQEGTDAMVRITGQIDPDPGRHAFYGELYEAYVEAYEGLAGGGVFDRLAKIQGR